SALAMFNGRRMRREQRTILLSAARSQLFNQVLAARVVQGSWDYGVEGEVWLLDGSRSVFGPEQWSETLAKRLAEFDIHPSGPLWGKGELRTQDAAHALELAALSDEQAVRLRTGLEAAGLKQERRALRLRPQHMQWRWLEPTVLELSFALPPGSYATVILREIGDVTDASSSSPNGTSFGA
ncbi:MAG: tRNA pseudouridine(13) synthase TruD, partial [Pseudomonadota bacterium]|nr:tRNA pseudouridine(13) synthase TruD [Pseudomonadota bacterium]